MAVRSRPGARLQVVVIAPDGTERTPPGLAAWLAAVAPRRAHGDVTIALVSDRRMRTLNRTFRGVDAVTDVLSFPTASATASASKAAAVASPQARSASPSARASRSAEGHVSLGDVVIATGVARRQAAAAGHALGTEYRVLALHGLLHLLGFDHEVDDGRMARTESRLRRLGNIPEGLIARGSKPAAPVQSRAAARRSAARSSAATRASVRR